MIPQVIQALPFLFGQIRQHASHLKETVQDLPIEGGYSTDGRMFTLNTVDRHVVCYSVGSMNSYGMLSKNPGTGIHETTVARTIDANGSNPTGYQGGT